MDYSWEGKIGFLEDIYIDERFRRKGIARRFFNLVAKEVVKNNGAWLKLNGQFKFFNQFNKK